MRILQTQTDVDADADPTSNSNSTDTTEQTSNSTTDGDRNGATPLHQGGPRHDGDFVNGTYIDNDGDNGIGDPHGRFPVALVAGIGGGVLFLLIVIIIVLCCCYCKKKKSQ